MIIIAIIILFSIAIIDFLINYWNLKKCPSCDASPLDIVKIDKEVVGYDLENPDLRTDRETYKCRICNHKWSVRSKYDENSEAD
ncbi:hypothetical protein [Aquimarina sp. 433]